MTIDWKVGDAAMFIGRGPIHGRLAYVGKDKSLLYHIRGVGWVDNYRLMTVSADNLPSHFKGMYNTINYHIGELPRLTEEDGVCPAEIEELHEFIENFRKLCSTPDPRVFPLPDDAEVDELPNAIYSSEKKLLEAVECLIDGDVFKQVSNALNEKGFRFQSPR